MDTINKRIKETGIKLAKNNLKNKKVISDNSHTRTIDGICFVGFEENELTELPGFQETPQLLNNISQKMQFNVINLLRNFQL